MYSQNIGFSSTWKNFILLSYWLLTQGSYWKEEIRNNILQTEKEFWVYKTKFINKAVPYSAVMKFIVDDLYAGKIGQRAIPEACTTALHATERSPGGLKGARAKIRVWPPREKHIHTDWNWGFFLLLGSHASAKGFFQLSHLMKAELLVNLSGLSTFLMSRLKCSHAERRGEGLK